MAKDKVKRSRPIITGHLERIGARVFDEYSSIITELLRGHQGIYALYKKDRLFYVGLASNLKSRIKAHKKDKLQNKWTHFGLYIIREEEHIKEIESLLLRISRPKGNSVKGNLKHSKDLRPLLKRMLREEIATRLNGIIGGKKTPALKPGKQAGRAKIDRPLNGLFPQGKVIYASYEGTTHKAWVHTNGRIRFAGQVFNSPSLAGIAITKKKTINGWKFWKYKNKAGELVYIDVLRN